MPEIIQTHEKGHFSGCSHNQKIRDDFASVQSFLSYQMHQLHDYLLATHNVNTSALRWHTRHGWNEQICGMVFYWLTHSSQPSFQMRSSLSTDPYALLFHFLYSINPGNKKSKPRKVIKFETLLKSEMDKGENDDDHIQKKQIEEQSWEEIDEDDEDQEMMEGYKLRLNELPETGPLKPHPEVPEGLVLSPAAKEWEYLKSVGHRSSALDDLMGMIGLEEVKSQMLKIKVWVTTARKQGVKMTKERFSIVLIGNSGTGKTAVARLYGRFLGQIGVLGRGTMEELVDVDFREMSATHLETLTTSGISDICKEIEVGNGGVVFVDEVRQASAREESSLLYLMSEVEKRRGYVAAIIAGNKKDMNSFFASDPGLKSRFPFSLIFPDYSDDELLRLFVDMVRGRYNDKMKVEGGLMGLYARIFTHRIGRWRGSSGFGNIRTLENALAMVRGRQADRLYEEAKKEGTEPDYFLLTKQDLIGPEPTSILQDSDAWRKLRQMIGLKSVKKSIRSVTEIISINYERELLEKKLLTTGLNRVFLGPPGTGKTTVARLYGKLLVDMGLLSSGEGMFSSYLAR